MIVVTSPVILDAPISEGAYSSRIQIRATWFYAGGCTMQIHQIELREKWRQRLTDAKLRLDFARSFVKEVTDDRASDVISAADSGLAYRQALCAEREALVEFGRIAEILKNLTIYGTVPDEDRDQEKESKQD